MFACFRRQSRQVCTSVESAEEKGTWLSPGEGHHQDADGRGLGGEEHGLSVGTEGEVVTEISEDQPRITELEEALGNKTKFNDLMVVPCQQWLDTVRLTYKFIYTNCSMLILSSFLST